MSSKYVVVQYKVGCKNNQIGKGLICQGLIGSVVLKTNLGKLIFWHYRGNIELLCWTY